MIVVEVVCGAEGKKIGETTVEPGLLTAEKLAAGYKPTDSERVLRLALVMDGVQMTCPRCHEPLFFRAADGRMFAACPGSVEVSA